ncbi:hypothetical protein HYX06_01795 [Candidatus Woesearchaeota archaeon]|nr:hypothetical protein [Candidatus Woesearchaeota archaeon]
MNKDRYLLLASAVFGVIALFHLARAVLGWEAFISGFRIPVYFSYLAALILASGFRFISAIWLRLSWLISHGRCMTQAGNRGL